MSNVRNCCVGCPLEFKGAGFCRGEAGGAGTGVIAVAEALGADEARLGRPLVGGAGRVWDRLVSRTYDPVLNRNLRRDDFHLANVLCCRPPDNELVGTPYEERATSQCRPYLESTLREFKPRCIVALGNTALKWFTGHKGIDSLRGYVFDTSWGPVVGTYHPAYIMRGKWNLARVVELDLLKALKVAREGPACLHVDKAYELSPRVQDVEHFFMEWRAAGRPALAFDIETPKAGEAEEAEDMVFEDDASYQILMCSFAWKPFHAISIPWIEPFITMMKEAFAEPADYLVWNAKFDVPRLSAAGVHFGGRIIDAMLAWHWLEPALPMGLKYVATFFCPDMGAWKLDMHRNFQWYNCADSDVLLRVYGEVQRRLQEQGRWRTFERHFLDYGKLLQKITERGVTVDHAARKEARERFEQRFAETVDAAREIAPREILSVHPKRGYKKEPKSTEGLVQISVELTEKEEEQLRLRKERERGKEIARREKEARKAARLAARQAREEAKEARRKEREAAKSRKESRRRGRQSGRAGGEAAVESGESAG